MHYFAGVVNLATECISLAHSSLICVSVVGTSLLESIFDQSIMSSGFHETRALPLRAYEEKCFVVGTSEPF